MRGWFLAIAIAALTGCREEPPVPAAEASPSSVVPTSVTMRVLAVNQPRLAEAIGRLAGEWDARSAGKLTAESVSWESVAKAKSLKADLIIFPTRYLGEFGMRQWLRPVRNNVLEGEAFDSSDVLPLARGPLVQWGGPPLALPLAVDLDAECFLAFAAPKVVSPDRLGVLFDPDTMEPRITEPAFVEALTQLKTGSPNDTTSVNVPLLGTGDLLLGVTTSSRNAATAFKLQEWLASAEISTQLAAAVGGMHPVRKSLVASRDWYSQDTGSEEGNKLADRITKSLSADHYLIIPRIPGVDDYLAVLDEAVRRVQAGEIEPAAALAGTAAKWEETTDRLGRENQIRAYQKHLGITED